MLSRYPREWTDLLVDRPEVADQVFRTKGNRRYSIKSLHRSTKHARTTSCIMFMKQSSSVLALESMQLNFAHHTFVVRNLSHLGSRFWAAAHPSVRPENRRHLLTLSCKSNSYPKEHSKCNPSQTYSRIRIPPFLRPAYANSFERGGPGYLLTKKCTVLRSLYSPTYTCTQ